MNIMSVLFSFSGRTNRMKYWLVGIGVAVVSGVILAMMGMENFGGAGAPDAAPSGAAGAVLVLVGILNIWINLANNVKRFHDRDKSGWWVLIAFVPAIGALWILIECGFLKGTGGSNRFGPDPLAA